MHIFHLWFPRLSSSFNFIHHSQVLLLIFQFLNWQGPWVVCGKWRLCQAEISSDALSQLRSNVNGLSVNPPKPSMPERMMPTTQGWSEHLKPTEIRTDFQVFIIKQLPYWLCWKGSVLYNRKTQKWFCLLWRFIWVHECVCAGMCYCTATVYIHWELSWLLHFSFSAAVFIYLMSAGKMESKMNLVIRLVYRGKEVNLGGNMCIQQAECMHPFRERQEEVGPAAGEGGAEEERHWGTCTWRGLGKVASGPWLCRGGSALPCCPSFFSCEKSRQGKPTQQ